MVEDREINTVFVEGIFKSCRARGANVVSESELETMACEDDPWCHAAVDTGEVRLEEIKFLIWGTK